MKHKFKGVRFNIWLCFFVFSLGILTILGFLQVALIKPYYRDDRLKTIEVIANTIENDIINNSSVSKYEVNKTFSSILNSNVCVVVFNDRDQVVYENDALGATCVFNNEVNYQDEQFIVRDKPKLLKANFEDDDFSLTFNSPISTQEMLIYGKKIKGNLANYYLYINSSLEPVGSVVNFFINQYLWLTIFVLVVAFIISILLANKICKPILKMKKEANKLASGDYSASFDTDSFEEINDLAVALNDANDKLGEIDELRKDMVANISHDIKTPLTMIKAYSEMILDISGDDKPKREEHLKVILDEVDYLDKLVVDMRELSQMQAGKVELHRTNFDLNDIVKQVTHLYHHLVEERHIKLVLDLQPAVIWADEIKIKQVVANYFSNAIKHSNEYGTVEIHILKNEDAVRLEVRDYGEGIAEKDLPYIWDRYFKIDKSFARNIESTGLGLAIVKSILEAHKAKYGVESVEGEGSTFYFEFEND